MRAIVYSKPGGPEVFSLVDRPEPEPGPGEVLVRVAVSGVNPTDWKSRRGTGAGSAAGSAELVPGQDGAGTIVSVGDGVASSRIGERVWLWEAAFRRTTGTTQELLAIPTVQAVRLPDAASFDLGASLGIPAMTAHRCLTVGEGFPHRLGPGALSGRTVLVAGGAGAVGHAAIELARWAGAHQVIATVSSPEKERLAEAAGAHHVVNYRTGEAAGEIRRVAPDGVDLIVEVAPVTNALLDAAVLAPGGTVAGYASTGGDLQLPVGPVMWLNARWQFVLVYTMPWEAKGAAVEAISAAVADGALRVGAEAGLPVHRFPLERTAEAQAAVEAGAVGKVLIDVA